MPTPRERLNDVIARLTVAIREFMIREEEADYALQANSPASVAQIEKLEEHLQLKLPPLYREFLLMHNGYKGLACPGSMLSIADNLPGSAWYDKIRKWKRDMGEAGAGEVISGIVIANLDAPSHWAYLDPTKPMPNGEMAVVIHLVDVATVKPDLIAFFETRIEFCQPDDVKEEDDEVEDEELE